MTRTELPERIACCQGEIKFLLDLQTRTNCTSCDHFATGICRLYKSEVPADFVKQGCDKWDFDDVPF